MSAAWLCASCSWQTPPGVQSEPPPAASQQREQSEDAVAVVDGSDAGAPTPALEKKRPPPPAALPVVEPRAVATGPALAPIASPEPRNFIGAVYDQVTMLQRLARARPRSMRPVGSTSTVFKVDLAGSVDAAFKSRTEDRPDGPTAEVAAYRLSRCLGLRNVPPAISREMSLSQIEGLLSEEDRPRWPMIRKRLIVTPARTVWGAAIYWVPDLTPLGIDEGESIERWSAWLSLGGQLPAESRSLAAHISTMLLWDYLIGNFDRFSGSNAQGTPDGDAVILRDHDVAFGARLSERVHERILRRMLRAERFSRSFIDALRKLTPARFQAELSRDPAWVDGTLVTRASMRGVFDRRAAILSHVDSLIAQHGQDAVLVFE